MAAAAPPPPPPSWPAMDAVLAALMNDGTFDSLRAKITAQLRQNEELQQYTVELVERSETLHAPGVERSSRRDLFEALKREVEPPVLERVSQAAWELIASDTGVGAEIAASVEDMYMRMYGGAAANRPAAADNTGPQHLEPRPNPDNHGAWLRAPQHLETGQWHHVEAHSRAAQSHAPPHLQHHQARADGHAPWQHGRPSPGHPPPGPAGHLEGTPQAPNGGGGSQAGRHSRHAGLGPRHSITTPQNHTERANGR
eukprot:SM000158S02014  [mRNA]  locus=s158:104291:105949:+ [translate_table: standard]